MASALRELYAQHGSNLSRNQRMSFVNTVLRCNDPISCEAWEFVWQENATNWDLDEERRAFRQFAVSAVGKRFLKTALSTNQSFAPYALVPGCGRGHDVLALAQLGFQSWGIDISETAINYAHDWIHSLRGLDGSASDVTTRAVTLRTANFFTFTPPLARFSLVYDSFFFCILPPTLRLAWGKRMGEIISMGGFLVVLISSYRYNRDGPPYPMSVETLTDVLVKGTSECRWVRVLGSPYEVTERWDKNKELIMVWKKESRGIQLETSASQSSGTN